jgi:hypothetical protein
LKGKELSDFDQALCQRWQACADFLSLHRAAGSDCGGGHSWRPSLAEQKKVPRRPGRDPASLHEGHHVLQLTKEEPCTIGQFQRQPRREQRTPDSKPEMQAFGGAREAAQARDVEEGLQLALRNIHYRRFLIKKINSIILDKNAVKSPPKASQNHQPGDLQQCAFPDYRAEP